MSNIQNINYIVAAGSVDGICTTAALLRFIGSDQQVGLEFCQAFTVDKVDPTQWEPNRQVAFVDLAVNNRDESMTAGFVQRIHEAGHEIVAVCDEHNAEDWLRVLGSFDGLLIKPVSQDSGDIKSSGALLLSVLGDEADEQTRDLCEAADAGDRMDFSTHFGGMVNQAVKSKIADDSRRVHLARHFAFNREPDEKIAGWIAEYETILKTHEEIIASREDLGDGFVRVVTLGKTIDMTTFMKSLYDIGYHCVVVDGEAYNKSVGKKMRQISFGLAPQFNKVNLVQEMQDAGLQKVSGFAAKANVDPDEENQALEVAKKVIAEALEN